jgi:hypothetical protein
MWVCTMRNMENLAKPRHGRHAVTHSDFSIEVSTRCDLDPELAIVPHPPSPLTLARPRSLAVRHAVPLALASTT